ncbi:MAG: ABC transporter permease, partial [Oscillospiraceae bacterium]|nr:ABC transporter permease [Oscillospiraceae bacterium]
MMHLLRKELGELITKQMLLGLAAMFLVIVMIGMVMTSAVSDTILTGGELSIIDLDETAFTEKLIAALEDDGYTVRVEKPGADTTDFASIMEKNSWKEAAVITNGFTSQLLEEQVAGDLYTVSVLSSTSALNAVSMSESSADIAAAKIRSLLMEEALGSDAQRLSKPAQITPYTVANGKQAQADSYVLVNSLSLFDRLMPLVLFMLVMLTSQTIITALAAEKTDKTLEALLSSPVPRSSVLIAKMLAALIVAVLYALVYGIGFGIAMMMTVSGSGDSMDLSSALTDMAQTNEAMITLGLQIDAMGWVMTVLHLILTICISLVASLVLGALIQDAKG